MPVYRWCTHSSTYISAWVCVCPLGCLYNYRVSTPILLSHYRVGTLIHLRSLPYTHTLGFLYTYKAYAPTVCTLSGSYCVCPWGVCVHTMLVYQPCNSALKHIQFILSKVYSVPLMVSVQLRSIYSCIVVTILTGYRDYTLVITSYDSCVPTARYGLHSHESILLPLRCPYTYLLVIHT